MFSIISITTCRFCAKVHVYITESKHVDSDDTSVINWGYFMGPGMRSSCPIGDISWDPGCVQVGV